MQCDSGGERKVSASRLSLTLKGGKQQGHSRVREGLKIDSILGVCIQWRESWCGVQYLPMPDIYYSRTGVYSVGHG